MSKAFQDHEVPDMCQPNNQASTDQYYQPMAPGVGTVPPTPYPPPPVYNQIVPMMNAPQPADVVLSLPYPVNNQEMFHNPPKYNPAYPSGRLSGLMPTETALPQPTVMPSPKVPRMQGIIPAPQYPLNSSYPNSGSCYPVVPVVVTTQATSTVISTSGPPIYKDYLVWSVFNVLCCCLFCGLVALIFSTQTRSAVVYQDPETARRKSRTALAFNVLSTILGIALIIGLVVYYTETYDNSPDYYG